MKKNITILSLLFTLIINACSDKNKETNIQTPGNAITDSLIATLETAPVELSDVTNEIKLNGVIEPDETKEANVFALVSGKITSVNAELGDYVAKGKILATLKSAEIAGATNDISVTAAGVDIAKKNLEAQEELYKGNLITSHELVSAQMEYKKALSEYNKSKQVGAITGGANETYSLRAPLSGYIISKNITPGTEVRADNNSALFGIADLSSVWVIASVYESDINSIRIGDTVSITTLANTGKKFKGVIEKIYNVLDPSNRTMKVRVTLKNPVNELKPGMFASVMVKGRATGQMTSIPSGAVVIHNSKYYVVLKKDQHTLAPAEVQIIKRMDRKTFVSGLNAGQEVVLTSHVFLFEALNAK
ncbi:MAG: efflux RND transporter periplasmic adaptor subunit [Ginsengibacter sp.]